jgi:hypothetical protein
MIISLATVNLRLDVGSKMMQQYSILKAQAFNNVLEQSDATVW